MVSKILGEVFTMKRRGITRVEVVVIVMVVGVILAVFLPAIQRTEGTSARAWCQSQMRQIGIALHTAQDTYTRMPPHCGEYPLPTTLVKNLKDKGFQGSTLFYLLPFVDHANLMLEFGDKATANSWEPGGNGEKVKAPKIYLCPQDPSPTEGGMVKGKSTCSYAVNLSIFWWANNPIKIPTSMPDGASITAMAFERYALCGDVRNNPWGKADVGGANLYGKSDWVEEVLYTVDGENRPSLDNPYKKFQHQPKNEECDPHTAQTGHTAGTNVLMGDSSVKLVTSTVSGKTWHAAITPNGGDEVGSDW